MVLLTCKPDIRNIRFSRVNSRKMQLVLHTGAHFTEEERLMKCLLRNTSMLSKKGVVVPGPSRYRKLLKEILNALQTAPASDAARDVVLDAILDDETADRVVLSHPFIFGAPRASVYRGMIFHKAPERMQHFCDLFPHDDIEMFIAIRNPATLLPALLQHSPKDDMASFIGGTDPRMVRWSETLTAIREAAPRLSITVWCNEDAPLIWSQIIRDMTGLEHGEKITGGFDLLSSIMSDEGMKRFRTYLKTHKGMSEMQKRRVIAAFLDKFALEDEIEEELDVYGWTEALIDEMSDIYDEDVLEIQRIPGVTMITP